MFLLNILPETLIHLLLIIGSLGVIAGLILTFIPFIATYRLVIQVVSVLILILGVYLEGGLSYKSQIDKEVADLKVKLAEAQVKSEKVNVKIITKVVKETQAVKDQGKKIIDDIKTLAPVADKQCVVPNEYIDAINRAARIPTLPALVVEKPKTETKEDKAKPKIALPPRTDK